MAKRSKTGKKLVACAAGPASAPMSLPVIFGWPLLLAAVAFGVYGPSLKSGFVYDAGVEIVQEGFITSLSNLPAVLSLKVLGSHLTLGPRPGQMLYLMLIAAVSGKEPFGYHLCSNLLHAANVALLFGLLRRLIATEITGLARNEARKVQLAMAAVTLIFALHPIAVESVAEVSYSSSLLVTFFTLLGLLAATAFRPENLRRALLTGGAGVFCAFAAAASKESGLAAALLLIVYWFLFRRSEPKGPWLLFLGAAMAAMTAFLAARFLCAPPDHLKVSFLGGSFFKVFLIQPGLWVFMMGKLLWPVGLSADYSPENMVGLSMPIAVILLVVVLLLQAGLAFKSRLGALGVAIYWLGLAAVSNFFPLTLPVADRFYYLPLAGVALQLLALLLMLLKLRAGFWIAVTPLFVAVVPLAVLTAAREKVFANDFSLWSETLRVSPFSARAHHNMGVVLFQRGQRDEGMAEYQKALKIDPNHADVHFGLGNALAEEGRLDEAMAQYEQSLSIDPNQIEAHVNLGNLLGEKGQPEKAIAQYDQALRLNPRLPGIYGNRGYEHYILGEPEEALADFRRNLQIPPGDADDYPRFYIWLIEAAEPGQRPKADQELGDYLHHRSSPSAGWSLQVGRYLLGELSQDDLLKAAAADSGDEKEVQRRHCEAYFYIGMERALEHDPVSARSFMEQCVATGLQEEVEYRSARAWLRMAKSAGRSFTADGSHCSV